MAIDISCYNNVIGLTSTDCDCFIENRPDDYNTSKSGLYITDLIDLKIIEALVSCTNGSIWNLLTNKRKQAISDFIGDTNALLINNFTKRRENGSFGVGQKKANSVRNLSSLFAGVRMFPARINSGIAKITNIGTIFEKEGTITLKIYNNLDEKIGDDIVLNTSAGNYNDNEVNIELPLYSKYGAVEYYFVFMHDENNRPMENKIGCGCDGFDPSFNKDYPYTRDRYLGGNAWATWAMFGGFEVDDISSFDDLSDYAHNYLNGLYFDVEFRCKLNEVLCKDALDFESNPLAISMAQAIKFKAAEFLATELVKLNEPNFQSLINKDELKQNISIWAGKYNEMVTYIAENANILANDCLCEKDIDKMIVGGIFS